MTPAPMLTRALAYLDAGYAVHWCRPRSKAPIATAWATRPPWTAEELQAAYRPGMNLGLRCGHWSTPAPGCGLVIIDIDVKHPDWHDAPYEWLGHLYQGPVVQVRSGSGLGQHWYFACPVATLPAKSETVLIHSPQGVVVDGHTVPAWSISVLSTGKQVVAPPSVHPCGGPYDWLTPWQPTIPLPAVFLEVIPPADRPTAPPERPRPPAPSDSIADQFNASASWTAILEPHGWQYVRHHADRDYWCRPGKHPRDGISASTLGDVFYCFSSSTSFEPCKGYSKFGAYAVLVHGGDQQQAAKRLYAVRAGRAA